MSHLPPDAITYQPIGVLRSPFSDVKGMPVQPPGALGISGRIDVFDRFSQGLMDLEGFSHVILLYHLHRIRGHELVVRPFLDTRDHGIFATRSPKRPNPIGLSVLQLLKVEGSSVHVQNVDILDNTPVLDIKPYVADFDVWAADRFGWFEGKSAHAAHCRSDGRFDGGSDGDEPSRA